MTDPPTPEIAPGSAPAAAPQTPPTPEQRDEARDTVRQETQDQLANLKVPTQEKLDAFVRRVKERGFDFAGENDSRENLKNNEYFERVMADLKAFFDADKSDAPANIKGAWMDAILAFMTNEIEAYQYSWGEMGEDQVNDAIQTYKKPADISAKGKQKGVGNFEQWVSASSYKQEYEAWKTEQTDKQQQKTTEAQTVQARTTLLGEVTQKLKTPLAAVAKFAPASIGKRIDALEENIRKETGGLEKFTPEMTLIEGQIKELTNLQPLLEHEEIPETTRTEKKNEVKNGRSLTDVKKDLEKALEEARKSPPEVDEGEDTPTVDSWIRDTAETWYGAALAPFVAIIAKLFGSLCKTERVRKFMVSQNLISHTQLVEQGIEEAKIGQKTEIEFRRFGLGTRLANMLGGKKTKDVVAAIRDPKKLAELTEDEARQAQFRHLANQIEAKGGAKTDATLWEFIGNNPKWTGVPAKPEKAPAAPADTPAPAVPVPAPAPAPLVAAAPATPPPPASPPPAPSV